MAFYGQALPAIWDVPPGQQAAAITPEMKTRTREIGGDGPSMQLLDMMNDEYRRRNNPENLSVNQIFSILTDGRSRPMTEQQVKSFMTAYGIPPLLAPDPSIQRVTATRVQPPTPPAASGGLWAALAAALMFI